MLSTKELTGEARKGLYNQKKTYVLLTSSRCMPCRRYKQELQNRYGIDHWDINTLDPTRLLLGPDILVLVCTDPTEAINTQYKLESYPSLYEMTLDSSNNLHHTLVPSTSIYEIV